MIIDSFREEVRGYNSQPFGQYDYQMDIWGHSALFVPMNPIRIKGKKYIDSNSIRDLKKNIEVIKNNADDCCILLVRCNLDFLGNPDISIDNLMSGGAGYFYKSRSAKYGVSTGYMYVGSIMAELIKKNIPKSIRLFPIEYDISKIRSNYEFNIKYIAVPKRLIK